MASRDFGRVVEIPISRARYVIASALLGLSLGGTPACVGIAQGGALFEESSGVMLGAKIGALLGMAFWIACAVAAARRAPRVRLGTRTLRFPHLLGFRERELTLGQIRRVVVENRAVVVERTGDGRMFDVMPWYLVPDGWTLESVAARIRLRVAARARGLRGARLAAAEAVALTGGAVGALVRRRPRKRWRITSVLRSVPANPLPLDTRLLVPSDYVADWVALARTAAASPAR